MFGSATETERDILSCASLTRALKSASYTVPCGHAKAPGSLLLHGQCIQWCTRIWPARLISGVQSTRLGWFPVDWRKKISMPRTYTDSQRLLSWFSGFSRLVIWQQSSGVFTDAVEKDWISRPSFHSSAYHTISSCSNNELLSTFFDRQKLVCDLNLLVRFQE